MTKQRTLSIGLFIVVAALLIGVVALRRWRARPPAEPPAALHYRSGLELARAGHMQEATGEWRLAIAMNPADDRPYDALATFWEATGRPDEAAQVLQRMARANPTAPHRDCRLARAAFAAGWVTSATAAAERAVKHEPDCPLAHTLRGIVLEDAGDVAGALAELTEAHQLSPNDSRIALTLAQLEGREGRRDAARRRVQEVLAREPDAIQAHYLLGWLLARAAPRTGATDAAAERQLRQVLAQNREHAGALAELGALALRRGRPAQARPLLEAARAQDASDHEVALSLAQLYARLGDARAASMAATARRLTELRQRRQSLRRRHRERPADPAVTLPLARLELSAGQTHEASDLVGELLRVDPNNRAALELLHAIVGLSPAAP